MQCDIYIQRVFQSFCLRNTQVQFSSSSPPLFPHLQSVIAHINISISLRSNLMNAQSVIVQ